MKKDFNLKYYEIMECLQNHPSCRIWIDGSEILVKTEDQANVVADLLEALSTDEDNDPCCIMIQSKTKETMKLIVIPDGGM